MLLPHTMSTASRTPSYPSSSDSDASLPPQSIVLPVVSPLNVTNMQSCDDDNDDDDNNNNYNYNYNYNTNISHINYRNLYDDCTILSVWSSLGGAISRLLNGQRRRSSIPGTCTKWKGLTVEFGRIVKVFWAGQRYDIIMYYPIK